MKRLIIEGDWRHEDGFWLLMTKNTHGMDYALTVADGTVSAVEDIPDPLPTEPGVRFWGKAQGHPGEWWFVTAIRGGMYVSSSGFTWDRDEAVQLGLVRLPDPEVTP